MTKASVVEPKEDLSSAVSEARTKVSALARAEVDRYRQLRPKKQEQLSARNAGDFKKAAELAEEVQYLENPDGLREERRAAIVALHLLQAQELENKAADLRLEVNERELKTKSLLAQLEDQENVELRQKYLGDRSITRGLASDADSMTHRAIRLRRESGHGQVERHGKVSGQSVDDLIENLMRTPEIIGPSIAAIYERAANVKATGGRGQRLELVFYNSHIESLGWEGIIIGERRPSNVVM
ncbi:MAG TPA: hypothetical protein VGR87_06055 [Candidatus Limnocylindria bacterium]|jgi:hypothetical protein|nr:hypothetical protein [Candidatus Limnocylindria bacterium]